MKPSDNGSLMSRQPMPLGDEITGICRRRANSVSSREASDNVTPWPMKITGRLALRIRSTHEVISSGEAPLRWVLSGGATGGTSTSSSSWNTLNGTSRFTGPGRPDSMVVMAWRNASGSMSTRVGWKLRLTTGRMMLGKSAWKCLLISWNGERLNCWVGTFAVMANSAEESEMAQASGITILQEPGPQEVSVATGLWRTRKYASA